MRRLPFLFSSHHWFHLRCSLLGTLVPPTTPHLLVLALLRGELLQHSALPDVREVLPQGVLARCGHRAAPGCSGPGRRSRTCSCPGATGCPVHSIVRTCFTDVAAHSLASDLLGDDGCAVRLIQRFWGETRHKGSYFRLQYISYRYTWCS